MNVMEQTVTEDFAIYNADNVEVLASLPEASIHFTATSIPFSSLFTYSNSPRDFGNSKGDDEFFKQFSFLLPEWLRVTVPGRLCAVHVMNLPTTKSRDGFIGLRDFRGDTIRAFVEAGWIYHSEVVIWKDPVVAMQRTKAIGLLWKQLRKDSSLSRQGIADTLLVFRKPGKNPEPITHTEESFPVDVWQRYASPVWMDINQSKTLQARSAREAKDERHLAPLQTEVIERSLELWTNPGDRVLDPFAGIGSTGYVALRMGRKFVGAELKASYYAQAARNLANAKSQLSLFEAAPPEDDAPEMAEAAG